MRISAIGVSVVAILATSMATAQAADLIIDDAPLAVVDATGFDWSGAYIGAHVGYGAGTFSYDSPDAPETNYDDDADGFIAGAQIGYNWQFDQIVAGLQSDFAYFAGEGADGDKVQWIGATTGRLGVALDNLLVYGKAGLAYGLSEVSFDSFGTLFEESEWHVGWTAGVGLEYAVDENISAFVEYDYVDLGSQNYFASVPPIGPNGVDVDYKSHVIKAGLNFSF